MNRREFSRRIAASALAGALWPLVPAYAGSGASAAPGGPKVSGPVTGGTRGYPFSAYVGDIARPGYVEEEFFLEGTGTQYDQVGELTPDGRWEVTPKGTVPFKTRMLVRRPIDASRFNGVVVLEWLNVTAGYDTAVIGPISDGLYQDGFVYVGVTCQRVGVDGVTSTPQALKAWDPERYGSLSIPGDSISFDILSQAGCAVGPNRVREGVDPLRGLEVKKVIATGASQSGGRLRSYINAIHPRDRVFDGFMPTIEFGMCYGFDDGGIDFETGRPSRDRVLIRTRIRDDLEEPVFIVNSETETLLMYGSRQPDTARFRFWEVAGASHVPAQFDTQLGKLRERDGLRGEAGELGSQVMWEPTADAALVHLRRWILEGVEPPRAEPIQLKAGERPEVVRDKFGNALGGVRLPELEVPTARHQAALVALNATAGLRGETVPFTPEVLQTLYPDRETYVARVAEAARNAKKAGVITAARVAEYINEAEAMPLGNNN